MSVDRIIVIHQRIETVWFRTNVFSREEVFDKVELCTLKGSIWVNPDSFDILSVAQVVYQNGKIIHNRWIRRKEPV